MNPLPRLRPTRTTRALTTVLLCVLGGGLSGCTIISPWPIWELTKATGAAASLSLSSGEGKASNTVGHPHPPLQALCIEYNPRVQVADIVPALQTSLREHKIESRVYESPVGANQCDAWLRYTAYIDWDIPPFGNNYKAYVSNASLTLHATSGELLSSSQYQITDAFGRSKWASTRDKLGPVVTALLTGSDNPPEKSKADAKPPQAPRPARGKTL